MHLTPEEVVDLAEGTRDEQSAPHVLVCARCRGQLVEARATLAAVASVEMPEPSPLFWDHLSRQVSEAVAADSAADRMSRRMGRPVTWWTRVALPMSAGVLAVLTLVVVLGPALRSVRVPGDSAPSLSPGNVSRDAADVSPASTGELLSDTLTPSVDASLEFVADLAAGLDVSASDQAGLASRGSAEHAVTHMSGEELRELGRLLREELARSGA